MERDPNDYIANKPSGSIVAMITEGSHILLIDTNAARKMGIKEFQYESSPRKDSIILWK